MRLTLSFDNGPIAGITPRVLDVLRERDLHAYFFVLGKLVAAPGGAEMIARVLEDGHVVGNHSYTHETPLGEDPRADAVSLEIEATERVLAPLVPGERRFRPFGGGGKIGPHLLREDAVRYLCSRQYSCVLWNAIAHDWDDPQGWSDRMLADLDAREHTVLVLHDIENACLERLPEFLDRALARGAEVTLDLPADCVPIARGDIRTDLTPLVAASPMDIR